jgi:hypothetical protein
MDIKDDIDNEAKLIKRKRNQAKKQEHNQQDESSNNTSQTKKSNEPGSLQYPPTKKGTNPTRRGGTKIIPYHETHWNTGTETHPDNWQGISISFMSQFSTKSHEELRFEDLIGQSIGSVGIKMGEQSGPSHDFLEAKKFQICDPSLPFHTILERRNFENNNKIPPTQHNQSKQQSNVQHSNLKQSQTPAEIDLQADTNSTISNISHRSSRSADRGGKADQRRGRGGRGFSLPNHQTRGNISGGTDRSVGSHNSRSNSGGRGRSGRRPAISYEPPRNQNPKSSSSLPNATSLSNSLQQDSVTNDATVAAGNSMTNPYNTQTPAIQTQTNSKKTTLKSLIHLLSSFHTGVINSGLIGRYGFRAAQIPTNLYGKQLWTFLNNSARPTHC